MAYCMNCGYALRPGSNFCENCGSQLSFTEAWKPAIALATSIRSRSAAGDAAPTCDDRAKNAARIAAIIALIGFFLPWASCQGLRARETVTGAQLASHGASGLLIIPVGMLIALGVLLNKGKTLQERATSAKVVISSGIASLVVLLYYWAKFNGAGQRDEFGLGAAMRQAFSIEIGAILSALGAVAVAISGLLHLQSAPRTGMQAHPTETASDGSSVSARSSSSLGNQGE